jgi:hypothetical protein
MDSKVVWTLVLFLLVGSIVAWLYMSRTTPEGFVSWNDYPSVERPGYIDLGKSRYNRLADIQNPMKPGIAGNITSAELNSLNSDIKKAIVSLDVSPAPRTQSSVFNAVRMTNAVRESLPDKNAILEEAKKCEANRTRDACSILGSAEYANCGVCIDAGTDVRNQSPGSFIGGMLMLPFTKRKAEAEAGERGTPVYEPTVGKCPPGKMFIDKAKCEKEVKRLNCKEFGESGGFLGQGRTKENRDVSETCVACAIDDSVYLHEPAPKNRQFALRVRAITPSGTGRNFITVQNAQNEVIAQTTAIGGNEILLDMPSTIRELDELKFTVIQEFPHRPRGRTETFQIDHYGTDIAADILAAKRQDPANAWAIGHYAFSQDSARSLCEGIGSRLATPQEITQYYQKGGQLCSWGWVSENGTLMYANQATTEGCGGPGVQRITAGPVVPFGAAWCHGVKPPTGPIVVTDRINAIVHNFFNTYGDRSTPSQEEQVNIKSEHGMNYEAPSYRAVILQWEARNLADGRVRRAGVESSITTVMGQSPTTDSVEDGRVFRILRRYGMFQTSATNNLAAIMSPNSSTNTSIMANQYWLWSSAKRPTFTFSAKVPGMFADPHYPEDILKCPTGPLVTNSQALSLLRINPCDKSGQAPGNYSRNCLKFLFQSAGGDLNRGELSPIVLSDLTRLTRDGSTNRDKEQILDYLNGLFRIATTGKTIDGSPIEPTNAARRRDTINAASMAMFGFEIVSPCEDVEIQDNGDILLVQKSGTLDPDCLNYLYMNAGMDSNRGTEDRNRKTSVGATYTDIRSRYSGLRLSEFETNKDNHPFRACQKTGKIAPIKPDGTPNWTMVNYVNTVASISGGTVLAAQNVYDEIHKTANTVLTEQDMVDDNKVNKQRVAVEHCYGLTKSIDSTGSGCGTVARYVRVLPSVIASGLQFNALNVGPLKVYNAQGQEVSRNKTATNENCTAYLHYTAEKPVVGNSLLVGFYTTTGTDYMNWMVDLGSNVEIRKIQYASMANLFGVDDYNRRLGKGTIVQILDADKKPVAHKVIPEFPEPRRVDLLFSKEDIVPPVYPGAVQPDMVVMLETAVFPDKFLAKQNNAAPATTTLRGNGAGISFMTIPALNGYGGAISLQYHNEYLYANPQNNTNGKKLCNIWSLYDTSVELKGAASWAVKPSLSGEPGWISLQNVRYPTMYLAVSKYDESSIFVEVINNASDETAKLRASWRIHKK